MTRQLHLKEFAEHNQTPSFLRLTILIPEQKSRRAARFRSPSLFYVSRPNYAGRWL